MPSPAPLTDYDLTPEMVELLRAGAADGLGLCCLPGQVRKNYAALHECERAGFVRFLDVERPWITDAGRAAIGEPSEMQADRARRVALFGRRRPPLVPAKRADPRTDFDYRSYKACGYVCTLLVKQPDARVNPLTVRVGKTLTSAPQYLGPNNSIVLEASARFLLVVMPKWIVDKARFSTHPLAIDETDPEFTDAERATWERLRHVCVSVNVRIQNAGRRAQEKRRYGEYA